MTTASEQWHRQPVLWLGVAILLASIAGCIAMVVLASRYPDEPLPLQSDQMLKVPTAREPEAAR